MKSLKTVHIDSEMGWSGGQVQSSALCVHLREHGHDVKLICRPGSAVETWAHDNGFDCCIADMSSTMAFGSVLKMRSIITAECPDVVHLHTSRAHVLGGAAARLAGVKNVVVTRHMDHPPRMLWPNTSAYGPWTTAVVAVSDAIKEVLVESGVDFGKIRVIKSGADIDRFESASPDPGIRERFGITEGTPIICASAFLSKRKGIDTLIRASEMLSNAGIYVHVIIAGDGDMREELEALVDELGVGVSFLGHHTDMPGLLAAVDVFVMPSLTEGLGVAAVEAMAAGKPVVASAVGGLKEVVEHERTGFLVPPGDTAALSSALASLIKNPELCRAFGSAGRARARAQFSLNIMTEKNEALYRELLSIE